MKYISTFTWENPNVRYDMIVDGWNILDAKKALYKKCIERDLPTLGWKLKGRYENDPETTADIGDPNGDRHVQYTNWNGLE